MIPLLRLFRTSTGGDETSGKLGVRTEMQVYITAEAILKTIALGYFCIVRAFHGIVCLNFLAGNKAADLRIVKFVTPHLFRRRNKCLLRGHDLTVAQRFEPRQ